MLEDMALGLVEKSESDLNALSYALVILGGIAAGVLNRSKAELQRAPYFAYTAVVVFLASCAQLVWLQGSPAIVGGYLWMIFTAGFSVLILAGYFVGKFAIARSYDAYGHGRLAALGFIPLANLWLLLTPSKLPGSSARTPQIPLLTGGTGVVLGFALLGASTMLSSYLTVEAERIAKNSQSSPNAQQAEIERTIKSRGVSETLRLMTADTGAPFAIDAVTTMAKIESEGTQLRRTYVVTSPMTSISEGFRSRIANAICAHGPFIPLLRANATIRELYVRQDGSQIGAVLINREICGL